MTNINVCFKELTELKLPDGVKEVYCSNNQLTELNLPDGVKLVYCSDNQLTELNLPDGVESVYCSDNNFPEEEKQRIIKYCDDNDISLVI